MSFVRSKDVNGHKYYQLVESYREHGRVRQRVLAHLGESPSLKEAIETIAGELLGLRAKRQALLDERANMLEELHQKLPNIMAHHGGDPPVFGQFLASRQYQILEHGYERGYFDFTSSYSRPRTAYGRPTAYRGYYGFMGVCGRYWRIPKEVEALEARIERTEARLKKLEAAGPS